MVCWHVYDVNIYASYGAPQLYVDSELYNFSYTVHIREWFPNKHTWNESDMNQLGTPPQNLTQPL